MSIINFLMKNYFIFLITLSSLLSSAQNTLVEPLDTNLPTFKSGEILDYKANYLFLSSIAKLKMKEEELNGEMVWRGTAELETTGVVDTFFPVDDLYETFFSIEKGVPVKFIRDISEGKFKKNIVITFNHEENQAVIYDKIHKNSKSFTIKSDAQDLLSSVYLYLRTAYDLSDLKIGDYMLINTFVDEENHPCKVVFLGKETIKTKFGKIECLKFNPYVIGGRLLKNKESITLWVSNDENKIPILITASLFIGEVKLKLDNYQNLKYPLNIIEEE